MQDYTLVNGELYHADDLKHYGVIGMKWGVRRGKTTQAYSKASKKLNRLATKADKAQNKANKKLAKAERAVYGWSLRNAQKAKWDAGRAQYKADKRKKRAIKWLNKMEKAFASTSVKVTQAQADIGKKYVEQLRKRADASSRSFI